jgi:hypothetical protein
MMDILERWQKTFNHEEPDYVSSFVQAVMASRQKIIDEQYSDNFTEEDLCMTPLGDYTIKKWCGFEASWGTGAPYKVIHPDRLPNKYQVEKNGKWEFVDTLPTNVTRYRIVGNEGHISEIMGDNRDINFYVEGNLYAGPGGAIDQEDYDAKETMDLWTQRLGTRKVELLEDATYDRIHKDYIKTIQDHKFLPLFGVSGFVENIRESFGIKAYSRFLRKNPEVIQHAVDLHEPAILASAKATAKAEIPFSVTADDIAYKHNVFCSPKHYKQFFSPLYRKVADIIHKAGGKIFFHSDGYTEPYFDTWINDCHYDGQESLEPQAWILPDGEGTGKGANLEKPGRVIRYLKEKYGDRFVLLGNMDMSTVMPLATPEEVGRVTKDIIQSGAPGGGFVFACCTDITDSTPIENVIAMREAYRKYRTIK